MERTLTDAQIGVLADTAVAAVRAHLTAGLADADRAARRRAEEVAQLAVTDAVVRARMPYQQIAQETGTDPLYVAELILDAEARGRALARERRLARERARKVHEAVERHRYRSPEGDEANGRLAVVFGVDVAAIVRWREAAAARFAAARAARRESSR